MHVLLQYQSKNYYIIGQEVYYGIGRFITLSGVFYYIIGQLLQYRAFITLSVGTGGHIEVCKILNVHENLDQHICQN